MRLLFTTESLDKIRAFSFKLKQQNIAYFEEEQADLDWDKTSYGNKRYSLWIYDEDDFVKVQKLLEEFSKEPLPNIANLPEPNAPIQPSKQYIERKLRVRFSQNFTKARHYFSLTYFFIMLCAVIFFATQATRKDESKISLAAAKQLLATSPVEKALLFDYPERYELVDKIASVYGYEALQHPEDLPSAGKFLYEAYMKTSSWKGIYTYFLTQEKPESEKAPVKMFEKLREGEVWRLFSPALLHADILHLFFNMAWLFLIGVQMDRHLSALRYLLFILFIGVVSNTVQYIISGPAFLGFSGIICGQIFFLRERQKIAPWEGYVLSKSAFQFILIFITTLAALSTLSFVLEFFNIAHFTIFIGNASHITGAFLGYLLGKTNLFSWRIIN